MRSTGTAASTAGTAAAASLRHTTKIAIGTTAIATLALKAALTRAGRKFTAALIGTLARTRSRRALAIRLWLRAKTRRHMRGIGVRIATARASGGDTTVTAIGIAAVAVAGTRVTRHAAGSGKRTVLGHRRTAEPVTLRANLLARTRLGNITGLLRTLSIASRTTALNHQEAPVIDRGTRIDVAGGVLETTALLRRLAFVCHQFVKVGIDDLARIEAQKTSIARNHALRIAARRHRSKVTGLEKLDDLRPDFDGVGDLLNGKAHSATLLEQHVTKACSHQNPPNSRSSRAISASTDSSAASPSSSNRTSRGLEPSGGPTTPFSSNMSIIRPARA